MMKEIQATKEELCLAEEDREVKEQVSRPWPYGGVQRASGPHGCGFVYWSLSINYRLVGLVVKASTSRAEDPGFESRLRRDYFGVESYQWLKNWHSSGYPARRLAL